jgi:hypothetical protein
MYDIVKNPIPFSGFWATPTLEELQARIEALPNSERAQAYTLVYMTMNACHALVDTEILSKEVFAQ